MTPTVASRLDTITFCAIRIFGQTMEALNTSAKARQKVAGSLASKAPRLVTTRGS